MKLNFEFLRGLLLLILFVGIGGWLICRAIRRSEEPGTLAAKWVFTIVVLAFAVWKAGSLFKEGGISGIFGLMVMLVAGVIMAVLWTGSIIDFISRPFVNLFSGGDEPPEPKPFYSIALARRKQSLFDEAAAEVRKQIDQFPTDFDGQMLLAEIQAENLRDLPAAEATFETLLSQEEHTPRSKAHVLNTLADWQLSIAGDPEAARRALERIVTLFPDSEMAQRAAERISHLPTAETLAARKQPRRIAMPASNAAAVSTNEDAEIEEAATLEAELQARVDAHPQDTEAREKLAQVYIDCYHDAGRAVEQMEILLMMPHQPAKNIVRWLNQIAHWQEHIAHDRAAARQTLQRIIDLYPGSAAAEMAQNDLTRLAEGPAQKQKSRPLRVDSHEKAEKGAKWRRYV